VKDVAMWQKAGGAGRKEGIGAEGGKEREVVARLYNGWFKSNNMQT
jgi:hypothetical protein